jgi:preprotein translocase subunit SecA
MDHLKEGIGLRGYAQQDPLVAYKKESFEMFESMMLRFQEDTARHLFRMQILAPDGTPIETREQLETLKSLHAQPPVQAPAAPQLPRPDETSWQPPQQRIPQQQAASAPIPTRAPTTTIDRLEREFELKKQRELEAARNAGGAGNGNGAASAQRRVGKKIGPNEPCFCGSGKKFKKCHGANA